MRYDTFNEFDFAGSEALEGMNLPPSSLGLFVFPVLTWDQAQVSREFGCEQS